MYTYYYYASNVVVTLHDSPLLLACKTCTAINIAFIFLLGFHCLLTRYLALRKGVVHIQDVQLLYTTPGTRTSVQTALCKHYPTVCTPHYMVSHIQQSHSIILRVTQYGNVKLRHLSVYNKA